GTFCEGRRDAARFCADFDEGNPPAYDWSGHIIKLPSAPFAIEGASFTSPPSSLRIGVDALEPGAPVTFNYLFRVFGDVTVETVHTEVSVKPAALAFEEGTVMVLKFGASITSADGYSAELFADTGRTWLVERVLPMTGGTTQTTDH